MTQPATLTQPVSNRRSQAHAAPDTSRLIWLLPVHAVVWAFAAWLSRGNLDTQGDMLENYVWGIEWQAGYAKHPPLFAWITAAWFRVLPHTDLAYFALSSLNAMAGLLGIVALAGRFLPRGLAIVAGLAMAVSPLYSNLAIKFNANAVLLSVWPWTAYFFVRFMQTGGWRSALTLGALAGAAVLGKYFSVVLVVTLLVAALARPAWRARLLDWRSLLVVIAGVVVLLPHVHWLVVNHFPTFGYAEERTGGTLPAAVVRFGIYTLAQLGYLLPSFGFVLLLVASKRQQAAKLMAQSYVRPSLYPDLWWLALGPLIVVGVIAILTKTQMASVWGMAEWFALVPLWLAVLTRANVSCAPQRAIRALCIYWLIVLVASAAVGYINARRNTDDAAEPRVELAAAVHALWHARTGQELAIAAGSVHEAQSTVFYSDGRTRFWDISKPRTTPWLTADDLVRQGGVLICPSGDTTCLAASAALSRAQPLYIKVRKKAWAMTLPARSYALFLMLPQGAAWSQTHSAVNPARLRSRSTARPLRADETAHRSG